MTALELLKTRGDEESEILAKRAGTTLAYFKQIAYRHSRPSPELAQKLAAESDGDLDAAELIFTTLKLPGERSEAAA
jgi:hypothetical protein